MKYIIVSIHYHWYTLTVYIMHLVFLMMQAKKKHEPKSLEDYLNDVSENPLHKLEVSGWNI